MGESKGEQALLEKPFFSDDCIFFSRRVGLSEPNGRLRK